MLSKARSELRYQWGDMKKIWRDPLLFITIIAVFVILAIFIVYPLYAVLKVSFVSKDGFTMIGYIKTMKSLEFQITLKNTF